MEYLSEEKYPEEWELIQFFGRDCDPLDKDEAEFFGRSRFTMTLDDDVLRFTVDRSYGDLYVTVSRGEGRVINLIASAVRNLRIERLHGRETLLAEFGMEPHLQEIRLTLGPRFQLDWGSLIES